MICILCQNVTQKFVSEAPFYTYWCSKCCLGFIPKARRLSINQLYTKNYFQTQLSDIHSYYWNNLQPPFNQRKGYDQTLRFQDNLLNKIKTYTSGEKLLDIGCATGVFLDQAKKHGFKIFGIEPSSYASTIAEKKLKTKILHGSFEKAEIKQKFDVITLLDVIEHMHDPREVFKKSYRLLNKNGILVIITPNVNSLIMTIARLLYSISGGKIIKPISRFVMPEHYWYFTHKSLVSLLTESGFSIQENSTAETAYSIIPMTFFERSALDIIFFCARLLNKQNRIVIVCRRDEADTDY